MSGARRRSVPRRMVGTRGLLVLGTMLLPPSTVPGGWPLGAGELAAQESASRPPAVAGTAEPLSLESAVRLALENNPAHLRVANGILVARESERESLGQMLPNLSASLSFNGNTSRTKTAFDDFGQPKESPSFEKNTTSSTSQSLSGGVTLFDLAAMQRYGAARARTDVQEAAVRQDAAAVRTAVGRAYYQMVERRGLIGVEEKVRQTAQDQLSAIRELLRVAAKQPTDVLGAELAVAQAEQSFARARGEARKAALVLNEAMGVALDRTFEPSDGFPAVFDPSDLDMNVLVTRALGDNAAVAQAAAQVTAAERGVSVARAGRFPSVSLSYSWGRGANLREYDAFRELAPENSSWGFGVRVGLPLFRGFQTSAGVASAELEAENARVTLREARLGLEREVRSALIDLENGYEAVQLAERSVGLARERLAQGQELYRLGTLDYTALSQMNDQVASAERQALDARFQFAAALLQLEEKVGGAVGADR